MLMYLVLFSLAILFSRLITKGKIEDLEVERVRLKIPVDIEKNEREIRKRQSFLKNSKVMLVFIGLAMVALLCFIIYSYLVDDF